jgi:hypothetical protein
VTGASDTLDPIAAAEAGIAGSKNLMAAVADELSQQQRWLAHYQVAEKRHARRLRVQGVLYRLDLARRAMLRFLRRLALLTLRLARNIALFVARTAVALFDMLSSAVTAGMTWLRPRAHALALLLRRWATAFWAWTVAASRALAAVLARWGSVAWAWTRVHAALLARASAKGTSIALSWLAATSLALAIGFGHWLVRIVRRTRALSRILARNALHAARVASTWTAASLRVLAALLAQWLSAAWQSTRRAALALGHWLVTRLRRTKALSRILARNALQVAHTASARIAATSHTLATTIRQRLPAAWKWTRVEARIITRASLKGTRQASAWTAANTRIATAALQHNVSAGAAWSGANARAASRASLAAAIASYSWAGHNVRTISRGFWHATPRPDTNHRALVVRRCTALACVEPKRARLPAIRAS